LEQARHRLQARYHHLDIQPMVADFTQPLVLPAAIQHKPIVGFFPGSTIGNFEPFDATRLLHKLRTELGSDSQLIIGVDLVKDLDTLLAAYNDAGGVTAAFNKNLLSRFNRELGADIALDSFDHRSIWNSDKRRIEMHLISRIDQSVTIAGKRFHFRAGESIHTENSHKFTTDSFAALIEGTGWHMAKSWTSDVQPFGVFQLAAMPSVDQHS
jgi:dimethylhistidine N-methyltransferase